MSNSKVVLVNINSDYSGQRLDNFLITKLKGVPKSRIYKAVRKGEVRVNSSRVKCEYKLKVGDIVRVPPVRVPDKSVLDSAILASTAKKLKAAIIFENDDYTVINKPSGLAVHAGSANDIGVIEALRSVYTGSRLELGHRIDKYTSGCLLLAKTRQGLRFFQDGIKSSGVVKVYRCIVAGKWPADKTTVDLPLLTTSNKAGHKTVVSYDGKKAVSLVEVISQNERYSLLEVKILTGRTHQIRVHLASSGYPIIGDGKYGWVRDNYVDLGANVRVMLHSYELSFPVGNRGKLLKFKAPVPGDFLECLRILENIAV